MKLLVGPPPPPPPARALLGNMGNSSVRLIGEHGRRTDALPLSPGLSLVTVTCEIQGEGLSQGSIKQAVTSGVLCRRCCDY